MSYLHFAEKKITTDDAHTIAGFYEQGYLFTRIGKGKMQQTRSARIALEAFTPSSENRRILKKTEGLTLTSFPLPYQNYHWSIGKMAKDFYTARDATFSANKIKELLTDAAKSNFTTLLVFTEAGQNEPIGYCIAYESPSFIHYSYPFYSSTSKDCGLGMMLRAILAAKDQGKKYIYLGSLQRPSDSYKLQFEGLEWFDGNAWSSDREMAKEVLQ